MTIDSSSEYNSEMDGLCSDVERSNLFAERLQTHYDGLHSAAELMGVNPDSNALNIISVLAGKLAQADVDRSPENTSDYKYEVMELVAINAPSLLVEVFIRYSGASRLTEDDAPELNRLIAEVRGRNEIFASIFVEIGQAMANAPVAAIGSKPSENGFVITVANACYRLRYLTPPDKLDLVRADTIDKIRVLASQTEIDEAVLAAAIGLISK